MSWFDRKRWIPSRKQILESRLVKPFAHHLRDESLWRFRRVPVARGAAVGIFFGFMAPVAQIFFAVLVAVPLRANIPVAAAATFITNPFTLVPIFSLALLIGNWLLRDDLQEAALAAEKMTAAAADAAQTQGWLTFVWQLIQNNGLPILVGISTMAVIGATLAYAAVYFLWRDRVGPNGEVHDEHFDEHPDDTH